RPGEELGARVVAVAVVVGHVGACKLADREGQPRDVAPAGDLVDAVLDLLLLAAEAAGLPEEEAGDVRPRLGDADPGDLAVGEAGDAEGAAETEAAGHLGVEHQLAALPEPGGEEQGGGLGGGGGLDRQQAVGPDVGRAEPVVDLRDDGGLGVGAVPRRLVLRLGLVALVVLFLLVLAVRPFLLLVLLFPVRRRAVGLLGLLVPPAVAVPAVAVGFPLGGWALGLLRLFLVDLGLGVRVAAEAAAVFAQRLEEGVRAGRLLG